MQQNNLLIRDLGLQPYISLLQAMHDFTNRRDSSTPDEIWLAQHFPVFTQGQAGKKEHILIKNDIPIVQSDRGGQVTYHGPGQLMLYTLLDLKRKKMGVRQLVTQLEQTVINTLARFNVVGSVDPNAPGVYINKQKVCSLGLRIRRGCSFHGLAINIDMDLTPFSQINPCGYPAMQMTQLKHVCPTVQFDHVPPILIEEFIRLFGYHQPKITHWNNNPYE